MDSLCQRILRRTSALRGVDFLHAKLEDVRRGRTTLQDKQGNDGADAQAVAGAKVHAAPVKLVEASRVRRSTARAMHAMMLAITAARRQREAGLGWAAADVDDGGDRGSNADGDELAGLLLEDSYEMDDLEFEEAQELLPRETADGVGAAGTAETGAAGAAAAADERESSGVAWSAVLGAPSLPVETDPG